MNSAEDHVEDEESPRLQNLRLELTARDLFEVGRLLEESATQVERLVMILEVALRQANAAALIDNPHSGNSILMFKEIADCVDSIETHVHRLSDASRLASFQSIGKNGKNIQMYAAKSAANNGDQDTEYILGADILI